MRILIQTHPQTNKIIVRDASTMELIENISRIDIYINSYNKAKATLTFNDIELDIELDGEKINNT